MMVMSTSVLRGMPWLIINAERFIFDCKVTKSNEKQVTLQHTTQINNQNKMDKNNDFVSSVKAIPFSQQTVYDKLADLSSLEKIRSRMDDPAFIQRIEDKVGADKLQQFKERISSVQFTQDSMTADTQLGHISLNVVEREAPKCVKFEAQGAPVGLLMWIQLIPEDEMNCKMRLT